ncbi:MAG: right-handed parallel beta-helix repeat-containing protein [Actinomycetota bacterium]|nr:right-handed parallel beta-helix repeat-containing protein [Actinomycetota bacterium]
MDTDVCSSRMPSSPRLPGAPAHTGRRVAGALSLGGLTATSSLADTTTPGAPGARTGTHVVDPSTLVSVTGASGNADPASTPLRTVSVATSAQLTAALAAALPGDDIVLAAGTYVGPFSAMRSGTTAHPVVVHPAVDAAVTLTSNLPYPGCDAKGPDENRTFSFERGASHWVLRGVTVAGGIKISSQNANLVQKWQSAMIDQHDWAARRAVPGSSTRDPGAGGAVVDWLSALIRQPILASSDVQIRNDVLTGRGLFGRLSRYGVVAGNTMTDIACGTGPAVWLSNYSHGNVITGNDVSRVAASTATHFMQEGIRLGNGSDYNVVTGNRVHDLAVGGRAFTTDQDSSWNVFTDNTADHVDMGFNEQQSGWGNVWSHNSVSGATVAAFSIRMQDGRFATPTEDSSSFFVQMSCNTSVGAPTPAVDFQAGAISHGSFAGNAFTTYMLNKRLAGYWASVGDTWNASTTAPRTGISSPSTITC